MWKRDEPVRAPQPPPPAPAPAPVVSAPAPPTAPRLETPPPTVRDIVNIGKSVIIKGELSASEDLTIEGQVDGKVDLHQNTLTIGANGRITAQVVAKVVIVLGQVHGNISATEKVDIRDNGSVDGDVSAPRIAIAEGAHFRGSIDMQQRGGGATKPSTPTAASTSSGASSSTASVSGVGTPVPTAAR
jgi:cytoskeletal protein CcmA (bactofilin family)